MSPQIPPPRAAVLPVIVQLSTATANLKEEDERMVVAIPPPLPVA
jgi:hypothetical protein